jgi:hypothetical protein
MRVDLPEPDTPVIETNLPNRKLARSPNSNLCWVYNLVQIREL